MKKSTILWFDHAESIEQLPEGSDDLAKERWLLDRAKDVLCEWQKKEGWM